LYKHKEQLILSDKTNLSAKVSSEDNFEGSALQKTVPKTNKRKWHDKKLLGEFKKIIPPAFDGGFDKGARTCLLNMGKYLQIYNYPRILRDRLVVYQHNGKEVIWWQDTKIVNNIRSIELNLNIFKKYLKQNYLTKIYYDEKPMNFMISN
jgi:hypothetical protein